MSDDETDLTCEPRHPTRMSWPTCHRSATLALFPWPVGFSFRTWPAPCAAIFKSLNATIWKCWRTSGRQVGGCQGWCWTPSEVIDKWGPLALGGTSFYGSATWSARAPAIPAGFTNGLGERRRGWKECSLRWHGDRRYIGLLQDVGTCEKGHEAAGIEKTGGFL